MAELIQGVIHGKTIILAQNPDMADGQQVEVVLRATAMARKSDAGVQSAAGMLADYPEMDAELEEILQERKSESRREIED